MINYSSLKYSGVPSLVDSNYIVTRATSAIDSAITATIDSDYINGRFDFTFDDDSADTGLYYISMFDSNLSLVNPKISSTKLYFQPSTGQLSASTFNSLSDEKFKKDVVTIENALDMIDNINAVKFAWDSSTGRGGAISYGVIAQELESVLPELVFINGNSGVKSVEYTPLIAILIQAIKELKTQIDNT